MNLLIVWLRELVKKSTIKIPWGTAQSSSRKPKLRDYQAKSPKEVNAADYIDYFLSRWIKLSFSQQIKIFGDSKY